MLFVCLFVCLSAESNHFISLKLDDTIGPTSRKNRLASERDPIPDTDSGSLFHVLHHCRIEDVRRFVNISHTVTGPFHETRRNDRRRQANPFTTFWERSGLGGHPNPDHFENPDPNPGSL